RHGHGESALRLAGALAFFWGIRGHYEEGRAHLARLLGREELTEHVAWRAKALWGLSFLISRQGDLLHVGPLGEECLTLATQAGDRATIVRALAALTEWAIFQQDLTRARSYAEEALVVARDLGDETC